MKTIRGTVNFVELVGYLGADPELRILATGASVVSFSVATNRFGARGESGQRSYETDWSSVEAWDKLAERCGASLHKGSRVRVTGSLHSRSWEDKESGQRRYRTVVRATDVMFLDARGGEAAESTTEELFEEEGESVEQ
jgi:single-strand DNA-binding protein